MPCRKDLGRCRCSNVRNRTQGRKFKKQGDLEWPIEVHSCTCIQQRGSTSHAPSESHCQKDFGSSLRDCTRRSQSEIRVNDWRRTVERRKGNALARITDPAECARADLSRGWRCALSRATLVERTGIAPGEVQRRPPQLETARRRKKRGAENGGRLSHGA